MKKLRDIWRRVKSFRVTLRVKYKKPFRNSVRHWFTRADPRGPYGPPNFGKHFPVEEGKVRGVEWMANFMSAGENRFVNSLMLAAGIRMMLLAVVGGLWFTYVPQDLGGIWNWFFFGYALLEGLTFAWTVTVWVHGTEAIKVVRRTQRSEYIKSRKEETQQQEREGLNG